MAEPNFERGDNESYVSSLVSEHGYKNIGWANSGAKFSAPTPPVIGLEEIDCSMYKFGGTNLVYINHIIQEIIHVDMSD